jgi:hypothetical protein
MIFVFGMIVGRTSTGAGNAGGSPTSSTGTAASMTRGSTTSADPTTVDDRISTTSPGPTMTTTGPPAPAEHRSVTISSASAAPLLNPAFTSAIALPIPGQPDIQSLAVVDGHLVALAPGYLVRISRDGHGGLYADQTYNVGLPLGDPSYARWELLSDGTSLWAISLGGANRVYRIDPSTLQPVQELNAPVPSDSVVSAAALDGHLYLNTDVGVYDVGPTVHHLGQQSVVARGGRALVADPTRHRLLVLNNDDGWAVTAYRPPRFDPVASARLAIDAQAIAVANGSIWVVGTTSGADSHLALDRLDPTTLTVAGHGSIAHFPTSTGTVAASGSSLWLRGGANDTELWCLDPHSGAASQHWSALPGVVAAHAGRAFVADGNVVGQLGLLTCAG